MKVGQKPAMPPAARPSARDDDAAPQPDAIPTTAPPPGYLREVADWVDANLGNKNGLLEDGELAAYARYRGGDPSYRPGIAALAQQMGLQVALHDGQMSVLVHTAGAAVGSAATGASTDAAERAAAARALIDVRGTATDEDVQLVASELARLPLPTLRWLARQGGRVAVCRGAVTEAAAHLADVRPRGWGPLASFHSVTGVYERQHKTATIATLDAGAGRALKRPNTVLHEVGHMIDHLGGVPSSSQEFKNAYAWDKDRLVANGESYFLQAGDTGREEAFAEMSARYARDPVALSQQYPNLWNYFRWAEENRFTPLGVG